MKQVSEDHLHYRFDGSSMSVVNASSEKSRQQNRSKIIVEDVSLFIQGSQASLNHKPESPLLEARTLPRIP